MLVEAHAVEAELVGILHLVEILVIELGTFLRIVVAVRERDPCGAVLAGALARSVKRAKLAILGRALPLLNNPLMIAEEYAILDNLTRGRVIAGFVRGIGAEYHAMGINPAYSQERYAEAHDLIVRAWTEPGPFPYVGKHYQFK